MIKQDLLLNKIEKLPRFLIIEGNTGSGKKTFVRELVNRFSMKILYFNSSIEDVRKAIDLSTQQSSPIIFAFLDADNMSTSAKNALLKVTEEPTENVYFILTLRSLDNTLGTIASRGQNLKLLPYTKEDLLAYRKFRGYSNLYDSIFTDVCANPGEVDNLFGLNVPDFFSFVNAVVDNINVPTNGNAFKITKRMKLKDSDDGFNPELLLKAIQVGFMLKAKETKKKQYLLASLETGKTLRELQISSISKQATLDIWIMNVRLALRGV